MKNMRIGYMKNVLKNNLSFLIYLLGNTNTLFYSYYNVISFNKYLNFLKLKLYYNKIIIDSQTIITSSCLLMNFY